VATWAVAVERQAHRVMSSAEAVGPLLVGEEGEWVQLQLQA
jgi:hypothetical protein